jgi:hypothetical protein
MENQFEPLMVLGITGENKFGIKFIDITEEKSNYILNPFRISGFCLVMFEAAMNALDESQQIEFEKTFKETFDDLFKTRHERAELTFVEDEDDQEFY